MAYLRYSHIFQGVFIIVLVATAVWLALAATENDTVAHLVNQLGLLGVFIVSLVSGFNVVVPIPAPAFVPLFVGAGLALPAVLAVMTLGMTLGDALGFWLGRLGREITLEGRFQHRIFRALEHFRERHPILPFVFLFAYSLAAPAPNELIVVPMALAGYRFAPIFLITLVGNSIFNTVVALGFIELVKVFA